MKRIIASIGLVAIGAYSLQADDAVQNVKPWSISGSLRGFYDDNYATQGGALKDGSWGLEVSPSAKFTHEAEMTEISASYIYGMKWYTDPDFVDQSHQFDFKFDHQFTERYSIGFADSFVVAQEPDVMSPGVVNTPLRTKGSNVRNYGDINFKTELTSKLGLNFCYNNQVYHYQEFDRSAELDRMEHLMGADVRWKFTPQTTGLIGYRFGINDFSDKDIGLGYDALGNYEIVKSNVRNSRSHFFLTGVDHNLSSKLSVSVRVGAQYYDYYKTHKDATTPYADAKVIYAFAKNSYVQAGIKHVHSATDILGTDANDPVLDCQSTVPYVSVSYKLGDWTASALGQYQYSEFNYGSVDNKSEDYYTISANISYQINKFLLAEVGYIFDDLESDVGRSFDRNRVYFGVRATY